MDQNIIITILLLLIASHAELKSSNYGNETLENLRLLEPKSLLENHRTLFNVDKNNVTTTNDTCIRDIAAFNWALIEKQIWAIQMLDASSKIPSGVLKGNIIDIGMYDECIDAEGTFQTLEIKGRHCMYSVKIINENVSLPIDPTMSICVPRSCSAEDVKQVLNDTISLIGKLKKLNIEISAVTCARLDKQIWDSEFIYWTIILGGLIAFLMLCSACESRSFSGAYANSTLLLLSKFSLQKNAAAILSTEVREGSIPVLNGLKVLSMLWVILGHEFFNQISNVTVNGVDILPWIQSWKALYVLNGIYTVDTFFTIGGFLMTFVFMKQMSKQKRFNVFTYYAHRYIRLTPAIVGLLIITIVYVPKIGSGARWDILMDMFANSCRDKLWPTLSYVQNTVNVDNACLGHLWYLAVDMQLFWLSPFILYPLYKKPKLGLAILSLFIVLSIIIPASIIGVNHYRVLSLYSDLNMTETALIFQEIYEKTYNRATPWLLGILLGYEVACKNRTLSKKTIYFGWLATVAAFSFCWFGIKIFTDPDYVYNPVWETFFAVASKPIWAFGICWLCFASINDCAGSLASFLSWRFFLPLSRLSYCAYLVHFVVQVTRIATARTPSYFSELNIWHAFLGDLIVSIVIAFFFCLVFESPAIVLEKVIFNSTREPRKRTDEEEIINNAE